MKTASMPMQSAAGMRRDTALVLRAGFSIPRVTAAADNSSAVSVADTMRGITVHSGGQKQRLAVATALLSEKPILIFDEPTSGLDYARMVEVSGVIRNLAQQGRIVLVVTHDREFMQRSCDRVLRL